MNIHLLIGHECSGRNKYAIDFMKEDDRLIKISYPGIIRSITNRKEMLRGSKKMYENLLHSLLVDTQAAGMDLIVDGIPLFIDIVKELHMVSDNLFITLFEHDLRHCIINNKFLPKHFQSSPLEICNEIQSIESFIESREFNKFRSEIDVQIFTRRIDEYEVV